MSKLKPLMTTWEPKDQEACVESCISAWAANSWDDEELQELEKALEAAFVNSNAFDATIEQRFDTLFGAFDDKPPSKDLKNKILGNLDRAGGSLLDQTQYTEN